jgi:hypothetical protein
MSIRLWISRRYAASGWFRLLSCAVLVAVNIAFMAALIAVQRRLEIPGWLGVTILLVWMVVLSGVFTWVCNAWREGEAA